MPGIFVGAPSPVTVPEEYQRWTALQHTWTCGDLSWDLTSDQSGVWLMQGVRGLNENPPITHYRQRAAAVPGSQWQGFNVDDREVFWPLLIANGDGSQAWLDYDALFWSTMEPDKTGVWSVTQPGDGIRAGETRSLRLRYESAGDPPDAPELFGWADYGVYLHAEQPYWEGETIRRSWANATPRNFYGGGSVSGHGYGPPFFVDSGSSAARASIDNPGPIAARPVWSLFGPSTSATFGVDGAQVVVPFPLAAGEWLRIDTDPTDQLITDCRYSDRQHFLDETRPMRDALGSLVADIGRGSPQGLAASKALTTAAVLAGFDRDADRLAAESARLFVSDEAREGMLAFLEKRPPSWVT